MSEICLNVSGLGIKGSFQVPSLSITLSQLKELLVERANLMQESSLKIFCGGRILTDDVKTLEDLRVSANSRLLVTKSQQSNIVASEEKKAEVEEQRSAKLARIKAAAEAMAKRSGGEYRSGTLALEDQSGTPVLGLTEDDRVALMTGLALHAQAQRLLKQKDYANALDTLTLGEEAFALCDPAHLKMVDNAGLLLVDLVWCIFKLRDSSKLASAQDRLIKAREHLTRCHGADLARLRCFSSGSPETPLYLRLEVLEGVAAWHAGDPVCARAKLVQAQRRLAKLKPQDQDIATLMGMGFEQKEAERGLRMCECDVARTSEFLVEQREKARERRKRERDDRRRDREQRTLPKTKHGKRVDMDLLDQLESLGYSRCLGAAALAECGNDFNASLDALLDPLTNQMLQDSAEKHAQIRKRPKEGSSHAQVDNQKTPEEQLPVLGNESQTNLPVAEGGQERGVEVPCEDKETGDELPDSPVSERDEDAENEIAESLGQSSAFSAYDMLLDDEDAIKEYLAYISSYEDGKSREE